MTESHWYKRELAEIERVKNNANDQYSNPTDYHISDISNKPYSPHKFAPSQGQTWESYVEQLAIYVKFAYEKNVATHINGVRRAWYTHRSSPSCFMCEDTDLHQVMLNAMKMMAKQYPKSVF